MKLEARISTSRLAAPFTIAGRSWDEVRLVHVEVSHKGVSGFGEASPFERYGETPESAVAWLSDVKLGDDPYALEDVHSRLPPGEQAARAAIEAALYDLQGKLVELPLYKLLGLRPHGPATSATLPLGSPDAMAEGARAARNQGFQRLKLKLGGHDGRDIDRFRAVREATSLPLQCDANEAWSFDEALDILMQCEMEYCEQPLEAGDPRGPELMQRSPVPIFVDEDCHTLADVLQCSERAHGINVKLAKAGGIREATRLIHAARALGLGVMLGCMLETGLGIAPAVHISSLADFTDLDGNMFFAEDPWPGIAFANGHQVPAAAPGLGVKPLALAAFAS